jgi:putative tryptophan/tyrosine transport system substrate-binding protein
MAVMRRRDFVTLLGGAAMLPLSARAQQSPKIWQIGYLGFGSASSWTSEIAALRSGLRDLGYIEGRNIKIEFRWAEQVDQTFDLATELVQLNVDVYFRSRLNSGGTG